MNADPSIPTPSRWFRSREEIAQAGYVPGWSKPNPGGGMFPVRYSVPARVGDLAVVFGLGQWREGVIVKITPSYVFAQYHVASSDRLWVGKGDRTGKSSDLYIRP